MLADRGQDLPQLVAVNVAVLHTDDDRVGVVDYWIPMSTPAQDAIDKWADHETWPERVGS